MNSKRWTEGNGENTDDLKESQPGNACGILKATGAQPGDCADESTFTLPKHQELNLTDQQCADSIARHQQ